MAGETLQKGLIMGDIYTEMVNAVLAGILENELDILDNADGWYGSTLSSASHALNEKDYRKFIKAVRKKTEKLRKQANGCPPNPFKWVDYYNS